MRKLLAAVLIGIGMFAISPVQARNQHLINTINAKLARWVHPSGKCSGHEALVTYYWDGTHTATGERFNPDGHTAASMSLPFGTRVTFLNPWNQRTVTVRINDRGPATHAEYDLARGAAYALGLKQSSYLCVTNIERGFEDVKQLRAKGFKTKTRRKAFVEASSTSYEGLR